MSTNNSYQSVIDINTIPSVETNNIVRPFNLKTIIHIICIFIINYLIGGFIFVSFNNTIEYTCKNQVRILNNIIDTCNMNCTYFNIDKCESNFYYCNHITNKINNYDDLCDNVIDICFKENNITTYNIIILFITLYSTYLLCNAIYEIIIILIKYNYLIISRIKCNICILLLIILSILFLLLGLIYDINILLYLSIGMIYLVLVVLSIKDKFIQ